MFNECKITFVILHTEAVTSKTLTATASAIIVAIQLLTRLPMKRGERPTVSKIWCNNSILKQWDYYT